MEKGNKNMDSFEQNLQNTFAGYQTTADAAVWANIEAAIAPKQNRAVLLWWMSGVAASLLLGFFIFHSSNDMQPLPKHNTFTAVDTAALDCRHYEFSATEINQFEAHNPQSKDAMQNEKAFAESGNGKSHTAGTNASSVVATSIHRTQNTKSLSINTASEASVALSVVSNQGIDPEPTVSDLNYLPILALPQTYKGVDSLDLRQDDWKANIASNKKKKKDDGWEEWDNKTYDAWALAANVGSSGASSQAGTASSNVRTTDNAGLGFSEMGALSDQDIKSMQDVNYHAPVILGMRGNWQFSKRLSLESGLGYTLLPASIETEGGTLRTDYRYNDHFISVPILLNYQFVNGKRFGLYSSQGFQFEKGIASNTVTTTYFNEVKQSEVVRKRAAQGIQGALTLGLGVDYKFMRQFSLYAEPTVTSWLMNFNVGQNMRNQQLLWPNFNVGVRFHMR